MQRPLDRDVNLMSPVQGKPPPVQVKESYGNLDMVTRRLHAGTWSVQSTPANNTRKRAWQYIEKERVANSIHRYLQAWKIRLKWQILANMILTIKIPDIFGLLT